MTDCEVTVELVILNLFFVNKIHLKIGFVVKKYQIVRWPICWYMGKHNTFAYIIVWSILSEFVAFET